MVLYSESAEETQKIGQDIGKKLKGGAIIFLSGILGAGKTEFIRGIAKGLGVKSKISSPTFNIMRAYDCPRGCSLYHFDCYRLKKYSDLLNIGWEEIIADQNSVIVLEWPECIADKNLTKAVKKKLISINIEIGKNNKRTIKLINNN